ncbi:MAG TPA: DNA mismatch repair protein MutS [Patescibacteria group bacterium]|nr:DNA mismatch repair protein MutS [Patescibacteria group bacterium]
MPEFSTPMMRQYRSIKDKYPDCLLFYRMGDFYELFNEDAHIGAAVLNITLTGKAGGKDGRIPMAGVPYHAVDSYIAKLVKAGYKVAICEQLSPPNKKGLVQRDVVRIVTPGTLLDENNLDKKANNYIVSILIEDSVLALAVADLSTGYFATSQIDPEDLNQTLVDELSRLLPTECILPDELYNDAEFLKLLKTIPQLNIFPSTQFAAVQNDADKYLSRHFGVKTLEGFGLQEQKVALRTAAALLAYLKETQKGSVSHIQKIAPLGEHDGMLMDRSTMINLELFATIRDHDTRGSLLSVLDQTITAMGGRMLKEWLKKPLTDKALIEARLDAVETFSENPEMRKILRDLFAQIPDIERLLSRLSVNLGNARDLVNLKLALQTILQIKKLLQAYNEDNKISLLLKNQINNFSKGLESIIHIIDQTIVEEPPITTREGRMIREGINDELDRLKNRINKSKDWIMELERSEKERTGITSLKVRFNKVFGFYIEVSKSYLDLVPPDYMRKQTLVNGERFITQELKEHEEIILTAEERINDIEYKIFSDTLTRVLKSTEIIQKSAVSIGVLDCLASFSLLSDSKRYVRPKILYSGEIRIKQGRHPVVEQLVDDPFVPNDVTLDNISQSLLLLTGPNMAGKSVFIRQVALIVLMAQIGCNVPATSAHISLCDKIFVRSGASDVITSGLSTFMVEMVETAHILNNATQNSLIIMDEIGRGTSTYDGISIAWAVAEYLVKAIKPSPKVLFATHYHELQKLEDEYQKQIKNFHMAVTSDRGAPVFLHTILPGGASHSYGVAVARLAGVPQTVIDKANEMLQTLEFRDVTEKGKQYDIVAPEINHEMTSIADHLLVQELATLDVANLTPLEALNKLAELKEKIKILTSKQTSFIEAD